jgi:uncharacterized DUF497 family protein
MTEFEWDEAKRAANQEKHKVDFQLATLLFDGRPNVTVDSSRDGEMRSATTGYLDGRCYTAIWTLRGEAIRFISVRSARDGEKRTYRAVHGEGNR